MLRIKENVSLKDLEEYGFQTHWYKFRKCVLWEGGIVRLWVDRYRYLHYNAPTQKIFDLIYKMHNLLELDSNNEDLRKLSRPVLLEENKHLKEKIKQLEKLIDKK